MIYKTLQSIFISQMSHHINANKIIPNEQKVNASNTYGTTDQLIINKMVINNVKLKHRNISTASIDYKKAFEYVPHCWIIDTLKIHKFDSITTNFLRKIMNNWRTSLYLNHEDGQIKTDNFIIKLPSFKEIACQSYSASYLYWTQAKLDVELIAKMILFHITSSWTILKSLLQMTINLHQW